MQKQITLNPGQSERVYFVVEPYAAGIYQVGLNGLSGSFEAVAIPGRLPPGVTIDSVSVFPKEVAPDGTLTVRCHLWNTNVYEVSFDLLYLINGTTLSQPVTLPVQWDKYVDFEFIPQDIGLGIGTYTVVVADLSDTFEVKEIITGIFYCPFGCTRYYKCPEESFTPWVDSWTLLDILRNPAPMLGYGAVRQYLYRSYKWTPYCVVSDIPYFETRDELAIHIAIFCTCSWWYDSGYREGWTVCPYCGRRIVSTLVVNEDYGWVDRYAVAMELIAHIETAHPDHPLDQPAWY